jgi:hypothetical protein
MGWFSTFEIGAPFEVNSGQEVEAFNFLLMRLIKKEFMEV